MKGRTNLLVAMPRCWLMKSAIVFCTSGSVMFTAPLRNTAGMYSTGYVQEHYGGER